MKKLIFALSLFAMTFVASAQEPNGKSTVDKTVVNTEEAFEVLAEMKQRLATISQQYTDVLSELAALRTQIGIGDPTPTPSAHEYVDLGLSVKWATCNVGAEKPEDYGLYFAWGETTGYTSDTNDGRLFNDANYKWMDHTINDNNGYQKYTCADGLKDGCWYAGDTYIGTKVDGTWVKNLTKLLPEDDAATANWGGAWRMPTMAEQDELRTECTWTWDSSKKGYKVTSKKNGNSIFLPAAGCRFEGAFLNFGPYGDYWSSELYTNFSRCAYVLDFSSSNVYMVFYSRFYGYPVRPVCP